MYSRTFQIPVIALSTANDCYAISISCFFVPLLIVNVADKVQHHAAICCRVVLTDHGSFVLINVYAPNAGPFPERPRAAYKYKFLEALNAKALSLKNAGRQVSTVITRHRWLRKFLSDCN